MSYEIYQISTYASADASFIKHHAIIYDDIKQLKNELKHNKGYHFRIHKNTTYIFFGDLDKYDNTIGKFRKLLQTFLKTNYNIEFEKEEFKYTLNNKNNNSFHYSIPKWNVTTEKLKEIHENMKKQHPELSKNIDTSIYSEHWYRAPNQRKGTSINDDTKHIIQFGKMLDFIVYYIQSYSENINEYIVAKQQTSRKVNNKLLNDKPYNENIINNNCKDIVVFGEDDTPINKDKVLSKTISEPTLYKKMFDECYKQERFDVYDYWLSIGMALKNTFASHDEAFELFNYFSSKGNNYDGYETTKKKFNTFIKKRTINKYTVATIYYYAIEDNKLKFIEIMNKNTFDLEQSDMCKYAHALAGKKFIYIIDNDMYKLYCFNGKIWKKDDVIMMSFLSNELYEFLKMILIELYFEHYAFNKMKSQIKRLKTFNFKKDVIASYKEIGLRDDIKFDDKWNLFGFNNIVYDLENAEFREYCYDDYLSTTAGYEWREPTSSEINKINDILCQIMPMEVERKLYLQILCTALDGQCLEKFIIFNGCGGNGKGLINDLLLLALGNYAMIGNNAILFEKNKTGNNPEKANMHKKRLVIFREPSEKNKFENSVVMELTGGGKISVRGNYENNTEKELNLTMIIECNQKPLFAEEPKQADVRRIIDILFRSTFTDDKTVIDNDNHIYLSDIRYKTKQFQEKHKFALLKILMDEYNVYRNNDYVLHIPETIKKRTQLYLEMSCNIISWFKENYTYSSDKNDICKMKDLYSDFITSCYFINLSKIEKKKYNKSYFENYIKSEPFFKQYYVLKSTWVRNYITCWKSIEECNTVS
jgi:hypothetical protein